RLEGRGCGHRSERKRARRLERKRNPAKRALVPVSNANWLKMCPDFYSTLFSVVFLNYNKWAFT
ncbi:hypothetical protein, partial [Treponema pectinovorum]|uniref:hypothetical protein n=1 Tax=Treponema pectinovorum TaxID=164 RepID=UPI001C9BDEE3